MNLFNIIDEIEKVDPDFKDRISPRRDAIKNITSFGSKVAVAALPFALGTIFKKAYGAAPAEDVIGVLNFALTLEYLESSFYNAGVGTSGLIPSSNQPYIAEIQDDENSHVTFLTAAITGAGGTPVAKSGFNFDFTAGGGSNNGPFATVFSDYKTFLAVAETFEDTGVRAYKGQAPNLLLNPVLTYALDIHAVEARHASAIRYLRTNVLGYATVTPWITSSASSSNDTGIAAVDANYNGTIPENNRMQLGIDVTTLPNVTGGGTTSIAVASAAFDEPLTKDEILALLVPAFIQIKSA